MQTKEYTVYNETRENFLSTRVTVIDTKSEPLRAVKALIEGLAPNTETGLWLNPLKNLPTVPRLSSYDLVYLDQECRVVQGVALIADDDVPPFDGQAASALVLPIHTFSASHTHPGDQVVLYAADEETAELTPAPSLDRSVHLPPVPAALQLSPPVVALQPLSSEQSIAPPALPAPEVAAPQQARSPLAFLRVLPRLRLHVSIYIAPPPNPVAAAVEAPALPAAPIAAGKAAHLRISTSAWLAPRVASARRKLVDCRNRYLRMAEIVVYGSAHLPRRRPFSRTRRLPRLEEEC